MSDAPSPIHTTINGVSYTYPMSPGNRSFRK